MPDATVKPRRPSSVGEKSGRSREKTRGSRPSAPERPVRAPSFAKAKAMQNGVKGASIQNMRRASSLATEAVRITPSDDCQLYLLADEVGGDPTPLAGKDAKDRVQFKEPLVYHLVALPEVNRVWSDDWADQDRGALIELVDGFISDSLPPRSWRAAGLDLEQPVLVRGAAAKAYDCHAEAVQRGFTSWREIILRGRGSSGETLLHLLFVLKGDELEPRGTHSQLIRYLLDPDVGPFDKAQIASLAAARYTGPKFFGETCMHLAAAQGDVPLMQLLIASGADFVSCRARGSCFYDAMHTYFGASVLGFAACLGQTEAVAFLMAQKRIDVNAADDGPEADDRTAEMRAGGGAQSDGRSCSRTGSGWRRRRTVGFDESSVGKHAGSAPESTLVPDGRNPSRRRMMQMGSEADLAGDLYEQRFLSLAAQRSNAVRSAAFCWRGNTILHVLVIHNQHEMFSRFVKDYHADPMVRNEWGQTPLLMAAEQGTNAMFEVALESISLHRWRFADLNSVKYPLHEIDSLLAHQNPHGTSVLHELIERHRSKLLHTPLIQRLLDDKWRSCAKWVFRLELLSTLLSLTLITAIFIVDSASSELSERGVRGDQATQDALHVAVLAISLLRLAWTAGNATLQIRQKMSVFNLRMSRTFCGVASARWKQLRQISATVVFSVCLFYSLGSYFGKRGGHVDRWWEPDAFVMLGIAGGLQFFHLGGLSALVSASAGRMTLTARRLIMEDVTLFASAACFLLCSFTLMLGSAFRDVEADTVAEASGGGESNEWFRSLPGIFMKLYSVFLYADPIDLPDLLDARFPWVATALYFIYSAVMNIVMLNLGIAILNSSYHRFSETERAQLEWTLNYAHEVLSAEQSLLGLFLRGRQMRDGANGYSIEPIREPTQWVEKRGGADRAEASVRESERSSSGRPSAPRIPGVFSEASYSKRVSRRKQEQMNTWFLELEMLSDANGATGESANGGRFHASMGRRRVDGTTREKEAWKLQLQRLEDAQSEHGRHAAHLGKRVECIERTCNEVLLRLDQMAQRQEPGAADAGAGAADRRSAPMPPFSKGTCERVAQDAMEC